MLTARQNNQIHETVTKLVEKFREGPTGKPTREQLHHTACQWLEIDGMSTGLLIALSSRIYQAVDEAIENYF